MREKKKIAIVDDDVNLTRAIEKVLSGIYTVFPFEDAAGFYKTLGKTSYDLILLDVVLPDHNGFNIARDILNKQPDLPVFIMSGVHKQEEEKLSIKNLGAIDLISKPFRTSELKARIDTVFRIQELESSKKTIEQNFLNVFESTTDIIFSLDKDLGISLTNPAFEKLLGYRLNDLKNTGLDELVYSPDLAHWKKNLDLTVKWERVPPFELKFYNAEKRLIPFLVLLSKTEDAKNTTGIFGIAKNLSSQKLDELAQSEGDLQSDSKKRELTSLNKLGKSMTSQTAVIYESNALSEPDSKVYQELFKKYGDILEKSVEKRIYKIKYNNSKDLRDLAEEFGFLKASPRDIININNAYFKIISEKIKSKKIYIYLEESRINLLEIMGYLALYYKHRNWGLS